MARRGCQILRQAGHGRAALAKALYLRGVWSGLNGSKSFIYEDRGALRGTPGSAYPQPEPNATELPSSAPGRPELIELQASAPSPTPTRAEEHIATTPDCRPRAPAPSPTPTRAGHLSGLQIVRLRALARRRAPKRTPHFTCRCERGTLHMKRWECLEHGRPQPRCCRCR